MKNWHSNRITPKNLDDLLVLYEEADKLARPGGPIVVSCLYVHQIT